jgi:hypothetical protein
VAPTDEIGPGIVTFARGSAGKRPLYRSYRSLIAAAAPVVAGAKLRPGDRLLTFIPPDDLKGLATGLVAGLVAGATVEAHCIFDSASAIASLASEQPTQLVVPGWMEPGLAELRPGPGLRSVILVHEPPLQLHGRPGWSSRIVDVVCCSEWALLSCRRERGDEISFDALCSAVEAGPGPSLLQVELRPDDGICLRGPAVGIPDRTCPDPLDWRISGLKADRERSKIVALG